MGAEDFNVVERYDPRAGSWRPSPPGHRPRDVAVTVRGKVVAWWGGAHAGRVDDRASRAVRPATDAWTPLPEMETPRHGLGGVSKAADCSRSRRRGPASPSQAPSRSSTFQAPRAVVTAPPEPAPRARFRAPRRWRRPRARSPRPPSPRVLLGSPTRERSHARLEAHQHAERPGRKLRSASSSSEYGIAELSSATANPIASNSGSSSSAPAPGSRPAA